ncbi:helix-turn-helix transcriptional regulator [Devosia sediminis]|uniref:Helix-turn-helix transcriptional regulator n=1 Tax=Devosia sediminis TaxID=2798801 RepID=A0A934J0T3_9HYPH|nr:helix-turn-helix transcriptional regulator [Devosia sediminis]MBJ3786836.1 helix-turn-helix transcriptional regulator [Devosia sediminis]
MSDAVLDLEQRAYEAALLPEFWPDVLERLSRFAGAAGTGLVTLNERGAHILCSPSLDEARAQILEGNYMARSGRAEAVMRKGLVGQPRFLNEHDYYDSLDDAMTDPIVRDVFRPRGMGWASGFLMRTPEDDMLILNVEQHYDKGPITGEALAALDGVYSIFARSAMITARADLARVRTTIETLADLGLPAAAVTPSGRITVANELFASASAVWTTRMSERLALLDPGANSNLAQALETVHGNSGQRSIPLRDRQSNLIAGVVQVIPIRRAVHDIFGSSSAIVVLNRTRTTPDARLVHALFDLTPAEIGVAEKIAAGQSVSQIAGATGRSLATIRNQLKSVMEKTGTSRQAELTLLMTQLSIPAGGEPK